MNVRRILLSYIHLLSVVCIRKVSFSFLQYSSQISVDWFKGFSSEDDAVDYATNHAYYDNASVFASKFKVSLCGLIQPAVFPASRSFPTVLCPKLIDVEEVEIYIIVFLPLGKTGIVIIMSVVCLSSVNILVSTIAPPFFIRF